MRSTDLHVADVFAIVSALRAISCRDVYLSVTEAMGVTTTRDTKDVVPISFEKPRNY